MEVYKITNKINGKVYIGSTKGDSQNRFKMHVRMSWNRDHDNDLAYDLMKYGWVSFEVEVLETIEGDSISVLRQAEDRWIYKYVTEHSEVTLYNQRFSGSDPSAIPVSTEPTEASTEVIITKELLTNGIVSVPYYQIDEEQFSNKSELLEFLSTLGITMNLTTLNLILGNHMVPKSVTSKYPNLKFIDNVDNIPTRYFYK